MRMQLPWSKGPASTSQGPHAAMASRFELKRYRDVVSFLRASMHLRREAARTPGNVGLGLAANPFRKTFWTLSSWESQEALRAFVAAAPHRQVVARFEHASASAVFSFWDIPAPAAVPVWTDADHRLAERVAR